MRPVAAAGTIVPAVSVVGERVRLELSVRFDEDVRPGSVLAATLFGRRRAPVFQATDPRADTIQAVDDDSLLDESGHPYYGSLERPCVYVAAETDGRALPVSVENSMMTRAVRVSLPDGLAAGSTVTIRLGNPARGSVFGTVSTTLRFRLVLETKNERHPLPDPVDHHLLAGEPTRLDLYAPSGVRTGAWLIVTAVARDAFGNPAPRSAELEIDVPDGLEVTSGHVRVVEGIAKIGVRPLRAGVFRLRASVLGENLLAGTSNPFRASERGDGPLWADLHGHSVLCDGLEHPDAYFTYGRDIECLDVVALTGHDDCLIERDHWGLPREPLWRSAETAWAITRYTVERFHEPGRFVTLLAWEWTGCDEFKPTGAARRGDRCIYFPADVGEIFPNFDPRYDTPEKLWEAIAPYGAIAVPHHVAYAREGPLYGCDWEHHDDRFEPLVEIHSKHGTTESPETMRPLWRTQPGGDVQAALARGYRLGFTGGSDTHVSRPGSQLLEADIDVLRYPEAGLTAIVEADRTRGAVFAALRARRTYATTGARILLRVEANGHPMGSELHADAAPLRVIVEVHGTDALASVEVIRDGAVVESVSPGQASAEIVYEDGGDSGYLYVRVTQVDGHQAWSSPIWVVPEFRTG
jgi:hypothetical protein